MFECLQSKISTMFAGGHRAEELGQPRGGHRAEYHHNHAVSIVDGHGRGDSTSYGGECCRVRGQGFRWHKVIYFSTARVFVSSDVNIR